MLGEKVDSRLDKENRQKKMMKTISHKIVGDTVLEQDIQLEGIIVGSTTVSENIKLRLHGDIIGDLWLREGSDVLLYGTVNGNIRNEGGHLEVFGIVKGKIKSLGGTTVIDPKAIIVNGNE